MILMRTSWHYYRQHRLQTLLLIFGIALGVALMISVDLANHSARRAFQLSAEGLTGKANYQVVSSNDQLPESLYTQLRVVHRQRQIAPVVEGRLRLKDPLNPEAPAQQWTLLGVDPFAEAPFRDLLLSADSANQTLADVSLLTTPGTVLLPAAEAERLGVGRSPEVLLPRLNAQEPPLRAIGRFAPASDLNAEALRRVLLTDIATAQELLHQEGHLSRIDVLLPEGDAEAVARFSALLPAGAQLQRPSARTETLLQMSRAFEINLSALSLLALLVGVFLIYNTVAFSVVQRRQHFAILRSLGATPGQLQGQILGEVTALGLLGAVLGVGLGIVLGQQVLKGVTQVINDMYYAVEVRQLQLAWPLLFKGVMAGAAAAFAAAWLPAREASRTPPVQVFQRTHLEDRVRALLPQVSGAALLLFAVGVGLLQWPSTGLVTAFAGLAGVVLGAALLVPLSLWGLLGAIARSPGLLWRLAARNLQRALSRSALATTALMLSVSVIIGVSVMVGSFRQSVDLWLAQILAADFYVRTERPMAAAAAARLQGALPEVLAAVHSSRELRFKDPQLGVFNVLAVSHDTAGQTRQYLWQAAPREQLWPQLEAGGVLISEPLARRLQRTGQFNLDAPAGQTLTLQTPTGAQTFVVQGIFYDYSSELGTLMLQRDIYVKYWQDPRLTGLALNLQAGLAAETARPAIEAALNREGLSYTLQANGELRRAALAVFDRTFAVTDALRVLTLMVAFLGVLSTILALHLERRRENALLRILGLTPAQNARLGLYEAACMGGIAGLLALPVGLLMSWVLIAVINLRAFGWSLTLFLQPTVLLEAWALAVGSALLAGLWPAWQSWRQRSQALAGGLRQT